MFPRDEAQGTSGCCQRLPLLDAGEAGSSELDMEVGLRAPGAVCRSFSSPSFFFFFFFCLLSLLLLLLLLLLFLGPLPRHMEVPRLGVESEL